MFHYQFTRRVHGSIWNIEVTPGGVFASRGMVPHWSYAAGSIGPQSDCSYEPYRHPSWDRPFQQGYIASMTRLTALRVAVAMLAGLNHTTGGAYLSQAHYRRGSQKFAAYAARTRCA